MRTMILILTLLIASSLVQAANPLQKQKVYSMVKQYQPLAWYEEQLNLWQNETRLNPKNAEAWLNVYTATRMIKLQHGSKTQKNLNDVVDEVIKNIPETFEGNYIQYYNSENKEEQLKYLLKAYELDPDRAETYDDFVSLYELKRDKVKLKEFCEKWFASNDISSGLYTWNYNMLMSCDENAIIITEGDNDTYPALILQNAKNIRKDVAVLNATFLAKKEYRDLYFKELDIPEYTPATADVDLSKLKQSICTHIQKNSNRPFYYANTVDPSLYAAIKNNVYTVGLAFKYSKNSFDNIAVLRKNYEKNFLKDYLKIDLNNDISKNVVDNMNGNYLVPFITLYNHYNETEEKASLENLSFLVNNIADKSGQTEEVNKIIKPSENTVISYVIKDPRDAMYGMLKINDNLHASQTEISNLMYNKFLEDLLKQKRYDELMIAKQEKVEWHNLLLPKYKDLTFEKYFEHAKPDNDLFPVCNITYEAAVLYCEWLTNIYNNLEHKKKSFKKVKFRLPTEKEWEMIARSGKGNDFKYPWGYLPTTENGFKRDTITNFRGCFLANIQTNRDLIDNPTACPNHDGGIFPVPTISYNPNEYGMYCMIGNVAEMTQEKGVAKGGGWNTLAEDAAIGKQQKYSGADPNVGFRVVMDVIEK